MVRRMGARLEMVDNHEQKPMMRIEIEIRSLCKSRSHSEILLKSSKASSNQSDQRAAA